VPVLDNRYSDSTDSTTSGVNPIISFYLVMSIFCAILFLAFKVWKSIKLDKKG